MERDIFMFYYAFQDKNCFISHIFVIQNTITLYHRKPDDADFPEILFLKKKFNLQNVQPHHTIHMILHEATMPEISDSRTHQHYAFEGDPKCILESIIDCLSTHQKSPQERESSFQAFWRELEAIKLKTKQPHPAHIQTMIDKFDKETYFIPESEIPQLKHAVNHYYSQKEPLLLFNKICHYLLDLFENYFNYQYSLEDDSDDELKINKADNRVLETYYEQLKETKKQLITAYMQNDESVLGSTTKLHQQIDALHLQKTVVDSLNSYIKRIESYKKGDRIDFTKNFWFFSASRGVNRQANYFLAKQLLAKVIAGEELSELFSDVSQLRSEIISEKQLSKDPNYVDRGLNSSELNKAIAMVAERAHEKSTPQPMGN